MIAFKPVFSFCATPTMPAQGSSSPLAPHRAQRRISDSSVRFLAVALVASLGVSAVGCSSGKSPLALGVPAVASAADAHTPFAIDVRSLGATGDGVTDDTEAFLFAIERAKAERRPVFVPRGSYVVSQTLVLERIAVTGPPAAAWPSDVDALPSILPSHRDGPAFHLLAGGAIAGLDIAYRWNGQPEGGPPAILVSGIGVSIRDVRLRQPWDGILADGETNVGRSNIENVFMVTPLNVGVRMLGTWDATRLSNIEVWNTGAAHLNRPFREGVGFHLGMNDLLRMTDCFVFGYHTGYLFEEKIEGCSIEGKTWGVMNGCTTDFCGRGIVIRGDHALSVSGGLFWNHWESLFAESGRSRVRVTGSELKSNGAAAVRVDQSAHVVVAGCTLLSPMRQHAPPSAVLGGGHVVLTGNHLETYGVGIVVLESVGSVVAQGNAIHTPRDRPAIVEASSWTSRPYEWNSSGKEQFVPGTVAPERMTIVGNAERNLPDASDEKR